MSQEILSEGFLTMSDTTMTVQPQKMVTGLKFGILEVAETKALISCMVIVTRHSLSTGGALA